MPACSLAARDVMNAPVIAVGPTDTVAHARNLMIRHRISRVLVVEGDRLAGILTQKDIGYRLGQREASWKRRLPDQAAVAEYATPKPVVAAPGTLVKKIAALFAEKKIGGVPVVEKNRIVGIVTKGDLMKSALVSGLKGSVRDVMEDAVTVSRWHSLAHTISLMQEKDEKLVVVNNDGSVAGLITETSLAFHDKTRKWSEVTGNPIFKENDKHPGTDHARDHPTGVPATAGDVMTSPARTVSPEIPLADAVRQMLKEQVNNLVVVKDGTLVGILKRDDIIKEVAK